MSKYVWTLYNVLLYSGRTIVYYHSTAVNFKLTSYPNLPYTVPCDCSVWGGFPACLHYMFLFHFTLLVVWSIPVAWCNWCWISYLTISCVTLHAGISWWMSVITWCLLQHLSVICCCSQVLKDGIIVNKGTFSDVDSYSAFWDNNKVSKTKLVQELSKRNVTDVYLCGLATDVCVGK